MRGASRASFSRQPPSSLAMYHLARHVFACATSRHYVFLDLVRDNYLSVPREELADLGAWIHGGLLTPPRELNTQKHLSAAAIVVAADLVAAGVLREGPPEHEISVRIAATPDSDLASIRAASHQPGPSRHLFLSVATALIYARRALRSMHISLIVDAVAARKRAQATAESAEWNRAALLTNVFFHHRPLFPWDYRCLFDSLALIRFLSRFNLYPDWVFGVQDDPFNAHCWVQAGTRVLNDDLEHVRSYTPIMTI